MIKFVLAGIGPEGPFMIHGVEANEIDTLINQLAKEGKQVLDTRAEHD